MLGLEQQAASLQRKVDIGDLGNIHTWPYFYYLMQQCTGVGGWVRLKYSLVSFPTRTSVCAANLLYSYFMQFGQILGGLSSRSRWRDLRCSLQLDWGLVWLPRSPPLPALVWRYGSKGRAVAEWRQGYGIGDRSALGTGYFSGSSPSALSFLVSLFFLIQRIRACSAFPCSSQSFVFFPPTRSIFPVA